MHIRKFCKLLIPPIFLHGHCFFRQKKTHTVSTVPTISNGLAGDYSSWIAALMASSGYDAESILEKTKSALLKVKKGEAVYERDSVLFDKIEYSWPVLAGLMWVAAQSEGKLNVLDFGGSLGSTYFQNCTFLSTLPEVRWNIVEQPDHVIVGQQYFEDQHLRFYTNIADCLSDTKPNVVLLGSVLQYIEHPYTLLEQILGLPCDYIIINRTPFWDGISDHLCVQVVPPSIYPASYPSWIFSKQQFHAHLGSTWQVMVTFDNPDRLPGPIDFAYQGAIIVRKKSLS